MKYFLYILITLVLVGCSNNKKVYWCGDHACVNKAEKEAFFKKTMIVEVRNINVKEKDKKLSNIELIKKEFSIEENKAIEKKISNLPQDKELTKAEKRKIAKNIRLEEKRRIKEEKIITKRKRKEEKIRLKKEKVLAKKNKKKNKKEDIKKITFSTNGLTVDSSTFKKLVEKIKKQNVNKPYPDINIKN